MTPSILADTLILIIICMICCHAFVLMREGRWMAFDPLNFFWIGIVMVYILQPVSNAEVLISWHSVGLFETTFLIIAVSVACVIAGYESRLGDRIASVIPSLPPRLDGRKVVATSCIAVFIGMLGYSYMFSSAGGWRQWLAISRGGTNYDACFGYIVQLKMFLDVGIVMLVLCSTMYSLKRFAKLLIWTLTGAVMLWYVYLGSRGTFILLSSSAIAACYLPKRRNPSIPLLALFFVTVFTVVNFQVLYRARFRDLSFNVNPTEIICANDIAATIADMEQEQKRKLFQYNQGGEFNVVMNTLKYVPDEVPYHYGYNYLELATRLVPKAWWPEKRYPGMEAFQGVLKRLGGGASAKIRRRDLIIGPAFTFVGYWYYLGGYVAVVLAAVGTGVFFRAVRRIYDRSPGSDGDLFLYSQLYLIGFGEAATTPSIWMYSLPFTLLLLIMVFMLCKVSHKSAKIDVSPVAVREDGGRQDGASGHTV